MRWFASLPLCGSLLILCPTFTARAADSAVATASARLAFAIPAQPLATALIAFGRQADVQVLTASGTLEGHQAPALQGRYSPADALAALLKYSGLTWRFIDTRTVVVNPGEAVRNDHQEPATTLAVTQLAPIHTVALVTDEGYKADVSSAATRTVTSLIDLPQSVDVITRDQLDNQQFRSVADAVQHVAGVQYEDGNDSMPLFSIRGFQSGNGMTDGLPNSIAGIGDSPPLIGVQRIEVLKGPEAITGETSGNNSFGGLINVVMKQPQFVPVHRLSFALGEFGDKEAGVDLAGPLGRSSSLDYRLVTWGAYADRTPQGRRGRRSGYIAPSIGWHGTHTDLVVGMQAMHNHVPIPDYVILLNGTMATASPPGLLLGNPRDHSVFGTKRFYYFFQHRFDEHWTFRSRAQYLRETYLTDSWILGGINTRGDVAAIAQRLGYKDAFYTVQNDVTGTFDQGWVRHRIVLGYDYSRALAGSNDQYLNGMLYNIYTGAPLPTPDTILSPQDDIHTPGSPWSTNRGLFVQDQLALGEHWNALLAWRRTSYELMTTHPDGSPWNLYKARWVPNVGVVWKPKPYVALYANTANGFQPDTQLGKNGRPLPPARARQVEAGAKFQLFQDRAWFTMSWYHITLDHSTDIVAQQPPNFAVQGPGQSNKGIELALNGRIAAGFDLSASYTRASIHNIDGSLPTGVAHQRFSLWANYRFQRAAWHGWGVGVGVQARSRTLGQQSLGSAYIPIPGQASVQANVSWHAARWSATLGVRNLFDRNLHSDSFNELFVPLNRRRMVLLTGTYEL